MSNSYRPPQGPPPELSEEYDEYVDIAVDFADGKLSAEEEEAVRERMRTDEMFRRVVEPILDSMINPAKMSQAEVDRMLRKATGRAPEPPPGRVSEPTRLYTPAVALPEPASEPQEEGPPSSKVTWVSPTTGRTWRSRFSHGMPFHEYGFAKAAAMIVAAILAFAAGFGGVMMLVHAYTEAPYVTRTVPAGELRLPLADSSVVQLEAGATLRYRKDLSRETVRVVDLEGDARFDIVHYDGAADFVVRTPAVVLKAEQARIAVRARPEYTEIWVEEGNVWAQDREATGDSTANVPGRYLLPGTHARISTADHQVLRMPTGAAPFPSLISPRRP